MKRRLLLLPLLAFCACSREVVEVPKAPLCKAVERAMAAIERLERVGFASNEVVVTRLDVSALNAKEFKRRLLATDGAEVHVWAPGISDWMIVARATTNRTSLAAAMDDFAGESESVALPEVFASYVGRREEILPAFASKLEGNVVAEWFVTKVIPELAWLDGAEIDADILNMTMSEIRSMQVVRRVVLQGNMALAKSSAKDKKSEDAAIEFWARAAKRNPRDSMILERLDRLNRNAQGFLEVGKLLQAMKCYETMILIQPNDPKAVHNFGICLKRIGKRELAEKVLKRAEILSRSK